jgi:EAL domain-containing protein (putative c-di-GMP-specific phosphodiesterase class I)
MIEPRLQPGPIAVRYQPIFQRTSAAWKLFAIECVMHTKGTAGGRSFGRKHAARMDRACISIALSEIGKFVRRSFKIVLNVHDATLGAGGSFASFLRGSAETNGIRVDELILDLVREAPARGEREVRATLGVLRELGCQLALEDVGFGHSNYKAVVDFDPDYLRLNRYFVDGCALDFPRQAVLRSLNRLARKCSAAVVAGGVEDPADLDTLTEIGIDLAQGRLMSRAVSYAALSERLREPSWTIMPDHLPLHDADSIF